MRLLAPVVEYPDLGPAGVRGGPALVRVHAVLRLEEERARRQPNTNLSPDTPLPVSLGGRGFRPTSFFLSSTIPLLHQASRAKRVAHARSSLNRIVRKQYSSRPKV